MTKLTTPLRVILTATLGALTLTVSLSLFAGSTARPTLRQSTSDSDLQGCSSRGQARVVCTTLGAVRGVLEGETVAFKGLPYAKPPTGSLRWRPTEHAMPWNGIRDAENFGPRCPQVDNGEVVGAEDCLTLNIWTPREPSVEPFPVMVYLTGGGNHSQSGQGSGSVVFDGTHLVPEGVILVTFNVRLGVLGFLTHPVLDAEREENVSGNYGNLDQIAMLRWLQSNIATFDGDPNRVFLFGTSAGGANICGLMTSPLAEGLFQAAAMESSVPTGCEYQTKEQAQNRTGIRLVETVGCDTAECLRGMPVDALVLALEATTNLFPRTYSPVVDGYVFPNQPLERIRNGQAVRIPVIIGNTSEETTGWTARFDPVTDGVSYASGMEQIFGAEIRDRVIAEYPLSDYSTPKAAFIRATTDALFTCQTRRVARAIVETGGGPVHRYLFTHAYDNDPARGVNHSQEYPFFFTFRTYSEGEADRGVRQQLVNLWTEMATTGSPSAAGTIWAPFSVEEPTYIQIGPATFPDGLADAHCDFWDLVKLPSPHL